MSRFETFWSPMRYGRIAVAWHHSEAMDMWHREMKGQAAGMDSAVRADVLNQMNAQLDILRQEIANMAPRIEYWRAFYTADASNPLLKFTAAPNPLSVGERVRIDWRDTNGAPKSYSGKVTRLATLHIVSDADPGNGTIGKGFVQEAVFMDNVAVTEEEAMADLQAALDV